MTSTPYVFAFSSNDTVLSKLSYYLTRNPSKKRLYIIEETEADVTFIYIDSDEETNYFLVNIFLPTRNYSTETPPANLEHIIFKHIPCFTEERILLEQLVGKDSSKKDLLKLKEDDETYTITIPSCVSPENYLRRLFVLDEIERIKLDAKKTKEKRQGKSNNLYNTR